MYCRFATPAANNPADHFRTGSTGQSIHLSLICYDPNSAQLYQPRILPIKNSKYLHPNQETLFSTEALSTRDTIREPWRIQREFVLDDQIKHQFGTSRQATLCP